MEITVKVPREALEYIHLIKITKGWTNERVSTEAFMEGLKLVAQLCDADAAHDISRFMVNQDEDGYNCEGKPREAVDIDSLRLSPNEKDRVPCFHCGSRRFSQWGIDVICLDCRENEGREYRQSPPGGLGS